MSSTTGRVPRKIGLGGALAVSAVLASLFASPARADFDITNTWIISLRSAGGNLVIECEWAFDQSGTDLEASGPCGPTATADLVGTIDPVTGVFDLAGVIIAFDSPPFPIEMSGSVAPDGLSLSGTHSAEPGGTFDGRLCGNRRLDPGETCDEGTSSPGCCTPTCEFKGDGVACSGPCRAAGTCASGVCNGAPKLAGTRCDPDGNPCTKDVCDGGGACVAGPCSPCCGGSSCTPAPRSCKRPIGGAANVFVKAKPDGRGNLLRFRIRHGEATAEADVGDPTTSSDYVLCVYTIAGPAESTALSFDASAPAGASWKRTRDGGARYLRRDRAPEGLARVRVAPGADGSARVRVAGGGPLLGVPFPVGPVPGGELQVQLRHAGACWGALFLLDSRANGSSVLRANQSFD